MEATLQDVIYEAIKVLAHKSKVEQDSYTACDYCRACEYLAKTLTLCVEADRVSRSFLDAEKQGNTVMVETRD